MVDLAYNVLHMENSRPKPTVLIVLDGYGIAPPGDGNAITKASRPIMNHLVATYPAMPIRASGDEVGLSWGKMGNSEVGHLTIGAGRVFYQNLPRIDKSIQDESFFEIEAFNKACDHVKKNKKSTLHLVGMVSPGGVHSSDTHLYALLELAKKKKIKNVMIHVFLDGRDAVYNSGIDFINKLKEVMKKTKVGEIASVSGRYYAMDRDNRWDRVEKAYRAITGDGEVRAEGVVEAIEASYAKDVFDEQFVPTVIEKKGEPVGALQDGDALVFFNFRPDRTRQLTKSFVDPEFKDFTKKQFNDMCYVTMTEYEKDLPVDVAFPVEYVIMPLARVVSEAGLKQFHIAETEKYAHITYFLNGMHEDVYAGEDRKTIRSPQVASYDEKPEMSAKEVAKQVVKVIDENIYDFIAVNFANADMVGHTGNLDATVKAVEVIDECIGKIVEAALDRGGVVMITADHGKAESMKNLQTAEIDKEHSTNPVPFIVIGKQFEGQPSPSGEIPDGDLSLVPPVGMLADIAPTVLKIMNLEIPPEMMGSSLV